MIAPRLVSEFPTVYGTRSFITVFTRARHLSLSWARWIQSSPTYYISLRSVLLLSSITERSLWGNNDFLFLDREDSQMPWVRTMTSFWRVNLVVRVVTCDCAVVYATYVCRTNSNCCIHCMCFIAVICTRMLGLWRQPTVLPVICYRRGYVT
jgi:hypothetical protein